MIAPKLRASINIELLRPRNAGAFCGRRGSHGGPSGRHDGGPQQPIPLLSVSNLSECDGLSIVPGTWLAFNIERHGVGPVIGFNKAVEFFRAWKTNVEVSNGFSLCATVPLVCTLSGCVLWPYGRVASCAGFVERSPGPVEEPGWMHRAAPDGSLANSGWVPLKRRHRPTVKLVLG